MRFELTPTEHPGNGLRRVAKALVADAVAQLDDPGVPADEAVHEARKDMKKLRGLLRLVRHAAPALYRAENKAFRDAAAHLSDVRDADVALETFDLVLQRAQPDSKPGADFAPAATPPRLLDEAEPTALDELRATLAEFRDETRQGADDVNTRVEGFRARLLDARERIPDWQLPATKDPEHHFALLGPGLQKTYKRGRKAMAKAYEDPSVESFHEWRKRTKYLGYHLRLLRPGWPSLLKAQQKEVKQLQSLLGDDHDLAVLGEILTDLFKDKPTASGAYEAQLALQREMHRQSQLLRRHARRLGELLYAERPKALRRRLRAYWGAYWHTC
jgi:CHAD domain-containing protein